MCWLVWATCAWSTPRAGAKSWDPCWGTGLLLCELRWSFLLSIYLWTKGKEDKQDQKSTSDNINLRLNYFHWFQWKQSLAVGKMPENSTAKVPFPKWKKIAKNQLLQTWAFTQQLNFQSYFMPINPIVGSLREKKKQIKNKPQNTRALSTPSAFSMLSTFEKSDLNLYSLIGSKCIFWRKCAWCYFSDKRTGEKSVIMVIWNWVSSMPKYTWLFLPVIHHFVLGCVCET